MNVAHYAKFVVVVLGSGVTTAVALITEGSDLFVVLTVLGAMLTSAGVLLTPNAPAVDDEMPEPGTGRHRAPDAL